MSGKTCQAWSSQSPHEHTYNADGMFPDESVTSASNFCRNPNGDHVGLWCYTTDNETRWEDCYVPTCGQSIYTMVKKGKGRTLGIAPQVRQAYLRGAQVHGAHQAASHIPAFKPSQPWPVLIYRPFKDGGLSKPRPRVQRATGPRLPRDHLRSAGLEPRLLDRKSSMLTTRLLRNYVASHLITRQLIGDSKSMGHNMIMLALHAIPDPLLYPTVCE